MGYTVSIWGIQMSAVVKTKCSALGAYSASLCKTFFHKEGRVRVHIATALTADWMEGVLLYCLQDLLQFPVCLAAVSCFLFSSCELSCVWAIWEERSAERPIQKVLGATKNGAKVLFKIKIYILTYFNYLHTQTHTILCEPVCEGWSVREFVTRYKDCTVR